MKYFYPIFVAILLFPNYKLYANNPNEFNCKLFREILSKTHYYSVNYLNKFSKDNNVAEALLNQIKSTEDKNEKDSLVSLLNSIRIFRDTMINFHNKNTIIDTGRFFDTRCSCTFDAKDFTIRNTVIKKKLNDNIIKVISIRVKNNYLIISLKSEKHTFAVDYYFWIINNGELIFKKLDYSLPPGE